MQSTLSHTNYKNDKCSEFAFQRKYSTTGSRPQSALIVPADKWEMCAGM